MLQRKVKNIFQKKQKTYKVSAKTIAYKSAELFLPIQHILSTIIVCLYQQWVQKKLNSP